MGVSSVEMGGEGDRNGTVMGWRAVIGDPHQVQSLKSNEAEKIRFG
jgi:hypothetical protein